MKIIKGESYKHKNVIIRLIFMVILSIPMMFCKENHHDSPGFIDREPTIEPDYTGITIPYNIAPMNFIINEEGGSFLIRVKSEAYPDILIRSSDGIVHFKKKAWKELLVRNKGGEILIEVSSVDRIRKPQTFRPFRITVSKDPIDPYLVYRILYPGYEAWSDMKIVQRSTENFHEASLFENQLLDNNCVNCHSFRNNDPSDMLLHVRGSRSGTYFTENGHAVRKSLKTDNMPANAVYPAWHPSGKFVAFSSNKTVQAFHSAAEKNIEVFDLFSSLVLYDVEKNEMMVCNTDDTLRHMETFPFWSPDGSFLYYCRAPQVSEGFDFREVKYDLARISFDPVKRTFGKTELLFDAASQGKSISFPTVSPDGKMIVFTLHNYGTFSIWHKEADLYLLDISTGVTKKLNINSNESESYHSWSSNGKWLVFSSKRGDGLSARPYFSYIYSADSTAKPFVLPQKDPGLYKRMKKTFNKPEFVTGKIVVNPRDFARAAHNEPVQTVWTGPPVLKGIQDKRYGNEKY